MADSSRQKPGTSKDSAATVSSRIAELLRTDIVRGTLAGGQRLNEVALAELYHVSRIPLREAIRILEGQGLVEIRPFGGAFVSELSSAEVEDIFEAFEALEAIAIRAALPNLTATDFELADQLARKAEREPDPHRWLELIADFYSTLYGSVKRRHLLDMLHRLSLNESRYLFAFLAAPRKQRAGLPGPRDFVKVLKKRDIESVLTFQREWRCTQRQFLVKHLDTLLGHPAQPVEDPPAVRKPRR